MHHQPNHYSLGSFQANRSAALIALVEQAEHLSPDELERRIGACLRAAGSNRDLLSHLPAGDPDRGWLEALLQVALQLKAEGRELDLLECSHSDGELGETAVAFVDHSRTASVREGDEVQAGFLVLRARRGLWVMPRIVRKLCSNGAITSGREELACEVTRQDLAGAVRACLEPGPFETVVQQFCRAADIVVEDARSLQLRARTEATGEELQPTKHRPDRSLFGAINNATRMGHGAQTWTERVRREQDAGLLLAQMQASQVPLRDRHECEVSPAPHVAGATEVSLA